MIYFSELHRRKIYERGGAYFGTLEDLIFAASPQAKISKIVAKNKDRQKIIIPIAYFKSNSRLVLDPDYKVKKLDLNELYVYKNLVDKQIIDLKGNKVVRVNDVAIQNDKNTW